MWPGLNPVHLTPVNLTFVAKRLYRGYPWASLTRGPGPAKTTTMGKGRVSNKPWRGWRLSQTDPSRPEEPRLPTEENHRRGATGGRPVASRRGPSDLRRSSRCSPPGDGGGRPWKGGPFPDLIACMCCGNGYFGGGGGHTDGQENTMEIVEGLFFVGGGVYSLVSRPCSLLPPGRQSAAHTRSSCPRREPTSWSLGIRHERN